MGVEVSVQPFLSRQQPFPCRTLFIQDCFHLKDNDRRRGRIYLQAAYKSVLFQTEHHSNGYLEVGLLPPRLLGKHPNQGLAGHFYLIHGLDSLHSKTDHPPTVSDSVNQRVLIPLKAIS